MIITKNSLKLTATILAKNEADIIGTTIEHHVNQGVSSFIVTDNGSTDNTKEIAAHYPEVKEIIEEPGSDHSQSQWVTRMAKMACKLKPDWIIHLDADELWCGLAGLRTISSERIGSTMVFLHPPKGLPFSLENMSYYLDFEEIDGLPGECKVAHRPDPDITITHGNHGFSNRSHVHFTKQVWRHHYPVRTLNQFKKKAVEGHEALMRRGSTCDRWKRWYELEKTGLLDQAFSRLCHQWQNMIKEPKTVYLLAILNLWSTPDVIQFFKSSGLLPDIGCWPV